MYKTMKGEVLAICDKDEEYVNKLVQYIGIRQVSLFKIIVFTEQETLLKYANENNINMLLISAEMLSDAFMDLGIERILILSSGAVCPDYADNPVIYKYQSSENILKEILNYFSEIERKEGVIKIAGGETEIIGVYSPVRRIGQTTFALTLGQVMAADFSVLYINLKEFSVFEKIFHTSYTGDLSDLMYFFRQNPESLSIKLQAIVNNVHGLDYIPPLLYSQDLRNIHTKEWIGLINKISETGVYKKIVIDLSSMVEDIFEILEVCNVSYMPVHDDWISLMKISAYEEYLLKSGREELLNKTIKVNIPDIYTEKCEENYLEQQLWGELGDNVRKMIQGSNLQEH